MVESKILDEKPRFFGDDGSPMKDLFVPTFKTFEDTFRFRVMTVTRELESRPLLCAQTAYNDTEDWDLFLKVNNISNPFDIQRGDVLIIPEESYFDKVNVRPYGDNNASVEEGMSSQRDKERAKRDDKERKEYLEKKKNRPTAGDGDEGIDFRSDSVVIDVDDGLDMETQNLRKNVLKKALAKANEEGNTVLSKQIAKLLKCE